MKRWIAVLLYISLLASLFACSPAQQAGPGSASDFNVKPRPVQDPGVTRTLDENILTVDGDSDTYAILDVNNITGWLAKYLTDTHTKNHNKSFMWSYREQPTLTFIPETPDLSEYDGLSFWVYADESAVGQSFVLNLSSENNDTEGSDYYTTGTVKITESGWHYYSWYLDRLSANRSPQGFDKIGNMNINSSGWGQSNSKDTVLYFDNIQFHTNMDAVNHLESIEQLKGAAAFCLDASRAVVDQKLVKISALDDNSVPFELDGEAWLPLAPLAAVRGKNAEYNAADAVLTFTLDGRSYIFTGEKDTVSVDGNEEQLDFTVRKNGDSLFVPAEYIMLLFGFSEVYTDEMGLVILSDTKDLFDPLKNLTTLFRVVRDMFFIRPEPVPVLQDMLEHLGGDVHPRVMVRDNDFERLATLYKTDNRFKNLVAKLIESCGIGSEEFEAEPLTYIVKDNRLLDTSRKAVVRISSWSLLYHITGDIRYSDRAIREMEAVCSFDDWHPDHFLDTGVMCVAVATGYDWLYDMMTKKQRTAIEKGLYENGIIPGLETYEGKRSMWGDNNWSGVCNGGLTTAAVALAAVYPEDCSRLISYCIRGVEASLLSYAPDGGYVESPGYWSFGTEYMQYMIASLDSACGTNYGLFQSPGFIESAYFAAYFETEDCSWNFNDGSRNRIETACITWFAHCTGDPDLRALRYKPVERGIKPVTFCDVLWYSPDISENIKLSLDVHYKNVGAVTMRNTWEDDAIFVGFCGGSNSVAHGDLDIGNFVIDGDGYRFLDDLGSDSYELPGYFQATRWEYYRKRAEGQNTLVIGDVSFKTPDQVPTAYGEFIRVESGTTSSLAVVDMTKAYTQAEDGARGILFKDERSTIIVQDEMHLSAPDIVRWQVHTRGNITISDDGRTAWIKDGNHKMYIELVAEDSSLKFTSCPADSYDPLYKNAEREYSRDNLTKLCVITENKVKDFEIAVVFRVLYEGQSEPSVGTLYEYVPIQQWALED